MDNSQPRSEHFKIHHRQDTSLPTVKKRDLIISIPFNQYLILLYKSNSYLVVYVMFVWLLSTDFTIESISIAIESSKVGALEHHFDAQNTYFSTFYLFVIHTTFYDNNIFLSKYKLSDSNYKIN